MDHTRMFTKRDFMCALSAEALHIYSSDWATEQNYRPNEVRKREESTGKNFVHCDVT